MKLLRNKNPTPILTSARISHPREIGEGIKYGLDKKICKPEIIVEMQGLRDISRLTPEISTNLSNDYNR